MDGHDTVSLLGDFVDCPVEQFLALGVHLKTHHYTPGFPLLLSLEHGHALPSNWIPRKHSFRWFNVCRKNVEERAEATSLSLNLFVASQDEHSLRHMDLPPHDDDDGA